MGSCTLCSSTVALLDAHCVFPTRHPECILEGSPWQGDRSVSRSYFLAKLTLYDACML